MKFSQMFFIQIGFIALTIVYFFFFIKEIKNGVEQTDWPIQKKKKFINIMLLALILWGVGISVWSLSGIMADFTKFPFNFIPIIAIPLLTVIITLFSKNFSDVLKNIPIENIIQLQSFRIFVELLLWALLLQNLLPVQMSFEGRNFDILAGITAPVIAWLASRQKISKTALIIWNIVCLGLLINIVVIAILSTPTPIRFFMNEPANFIVTYFPVSLLPGLLVPLAYTLHFYSLKQLLIKPETISKKQPA